VLYLPYVRTTTYLGRKTAQTQRAITSRNVKILHYFVSASVEMKL
jgi:hypothetical protein